jgi:formamidopyrimidine-DNA glycosylase
MAELPELTILRRQMDESLRGRVIAAVEVNQEKCLNVPAEALVRALIDRRIVEVTRRGKWLYLHLDSGYHLLLNLGMGADLWHYRPGEDLPAKYQFRLGLDDGSGFTCRFWWVGYLRLLSPEELPAHPETAKLGPCPLELTPEEFAGRARKYPRGTVKSLLLDQDKLSGIGNAYAHDILWEAQLHPQRKLGSLTPGELARFHQAIQVVTTRALERGGIERDFYRSGGNLETWGSFFQVGYKQGQPCPRCGAAVEAIKTGSTTTFICPQCQPVGSADADAPKG